MIQSKLEWLRRYVLHLLGIRLKLKLELSHFLRPSLTVSTNLICMWMLLVSRLDLIIDVIYDRFELQ